MYCFFFTFLHYHICTINVQLAAWFEALTLNHWVSHKIQFKLNKIIMLFLGCPNFSSCNNTYFFLKAVARLLVNFSEILKTDQ